MKSSIEQEKNYDKELDSLLLKIREEIQSHLTFLDKAVSSQENFEQYVLELNSFYYQTFHQKIFPIYRKTIKDDISSLYSFSMQEESLKNNIINNIKYNARLYNQLKNISFLLSSSTEKIRAIFHSFSRENEQRNIKLLYVLKHLQNSLISMQEILKNLTQLRADEKLINSLNSYPSLLMVIAIINSWDLKRIKNSRELNRLQVKLQLDLNLLIKMQLNKEHTGKNINELISEIQKSHKNFIAKKLSHEMLSFYENHIVKHYDFYTGLLKIYRINNESRNLNSIAQQFENWLTSLLYIIDKTAFHSGNPEYDYLNNIAGLSKLNPKELGNIEIYSQKIIALFTELGEHLGSQQADFKHFSTRITNIINDMSTYFAALQENSTFQTIPVLNHALDKLCSELSYCELKINLLDQQEKTTTLIIQEYEKMTLLVDSYLEFISNLKGQLYRELAPRNISRYFKELNLKIEHIPLENGQSFPHEYNYILQKSGIDLPSYSEKDLIIKESNGDLFVIHLDDILDYELPAIKFMERT